MPNTILRSGPDASSAARPREAAGRRRRVAVWTRRRVAVWTQAAASGGTEPSRSSAMISEHSSTHSEQIAIAGVGPAITLSTLGRRACRRTSSELIRGRRRRIARIEAERQGHGSTCDRLHPQLRAHSSRAPRLSATRSTSEDTSRHDCRERARATSYARFGRRRARRSRARRGYDPDAALIRTGRGHPVHPPHAHVRDLLDLGQLVR